MDANEREYFRYLFDIIYKIDKIKNFATPNCMGAGKDATALRREILDFG